MGQGLAEHNYSEHALWCLDRAIKIAHQVPECGFPKIASIGKATALIQLNRFDEARTVIEQGLAYARKNGFLGYQVDMLAQSAQLAVKEKDIDEAIRRYELAADLAARIHFNRGLAEVNSQLAALHQQMGNLRKAADCAAKSVGAHRELGEVYVIPHHLSVKAAIEAQAGDTAEAERSFQSAEQVVRTMLIHAPTLLAKKAVIAAMSEVFVAHFEMAANILHDIPKAYAIIEEARGRVEADRLRSQTTHLVSRTQAQLDAEKRVTILQSRLLDTQGPAEREQLSDALLDMESALAPVYPIKLPTPEPGHPMSLHELQRTLGYDELLLEYVLGDKRSYCISVTRDHTGVNALADRASLDKLVDKYLQEIKAQRSGQTEGRALFSAILEPIHDYASKTRVIVVPDGSLHRLPFSALYTPGNAYVVESHSITYVPSGTVLALVRNRTVPLADSLLAVGNVAYKQNSFSTPLTAGIKLFRGLSSLRRDSLLSLPSTEEEIRSVQSILGNGGVLLSGAQATEANFKRAVNRKFSIIHLAVHGFADRAYPDRAGLVLAPDPNEDGLLQVREIRALPLEETSLVTLSACDTNNGRIEGLEGVSSIVSAFLYAGAKSAVASFWPVEDAAATTLMKSFYQHLALGEHKAEALRNAQIEFLRKGGPTQVPFFWAGFNLVGEGAEGIMLQREKS